MTFRNATSAAAAIPPILAVLVVGCGPQDSATVRHGELPTSVTHRTEVSETLLTTAESDRRQMKLRPSNGMLATADGTVYVLNVASSALMHFGSPDGTVATIGQPGEGPGDLGEPCCLGFAGDQMSIVVFEDANRRYTIFDQRLKFLRSVNVGVDRLWDVGSVQLADGSIVHPRIAFTGLSDANHPQLLRFDSSGTVLDSVLVNVPPGMVPQRVSFENGNGTGIMLEQPFGGTVLYALGRGGDFALANSATYRIHLRRGDGKIRELTGPDLVGAVVTASERRQMQDRLTRSLAQFGKTAEDLPFTMPEHHAPLRAIFFDAEARLWVRYRRLGDPWDVGDVYSPAGEKLMILAIPTGIELAPLSIQGSTGLGVITDADGIPAILRLRFVPARSGS
jgi:hypothetical protein